MASYPLDSPITARRPSSSAYVDLEARPLSRVLAPEPGIMVYVGDGTQPPWTGYAPGLIILSGQRTRRWHVLGWLDGRSLEPLRIAGFWGWMQADTRTTYERTMNALGDWIWGAPSDARKVVAEGDVLGYTAPTRGAVRWSVLDPSVVNPQGPPYVAPLAWAAAQGLPPPAYIDDASAPPPSSSSGDGAGLALLLGLYLLSEGL